MSHIFCWTRGALKTTEGKAEVPSLDKEGWLRPLRKCREASVAGADRVVGSSHRLSEVERTTPFLMFRPTGLTLRAAPPKERDHLLDGAATPPLPRSIQSCPAGQRQNTQETAPSKTKDLSAQFLERGLTSRFPVVPERPCPADDLWVIISTQEGNSGTRSPFTQPLQGLRALQ